MGQLNRRTNLVLHPAAQVIVRGNSAVQFGLDASRAGILTTDRARDLAHVLTRLERPCPEGFLRARLRAIGFTAHDIDGILEELRAYGVVRAHRGHAVVVIGHSPLTTATVRLLRDTGISVYRATSAADEQELLTNADDHRPLVLIDRPATSADDALALVQHRASSVAVSLLDSRGFLGPVRVGGEGPCPLCVQLHWVTHDEYFHRITTRLFDPDANRPLRQDPVAVAATAAGAAALTARVLGLGYGPQLLNGFPAPGLSLVIDPYDPDQGHRFHLERHPGCPACFEAETRRGKARAA